jgi:hypothetical protein
MIEKAKEKWPLIAGVVGGVVVLILGYIYFFRFASTGVVPVDASGAKVVTSGGPSYGKLSAVSPVPA